MSLPYDREDELILALLEAKEPLPSAEPAEEEQVLSRLYGEVLGLVAQSVEPVAPPPQLKDALLARVRKGAPRLSAAPAIRAVEKPAETAEPPAPATPTSALEFRSFPLARPEPPPTIRKARRWPALFAAGLALVSSTGAAWFWTQAQESSNQVRLLEQKLAAVGRERQLAQAEIASLREASAGLVEKLALITRPGAAVCALKPPGALPAQAQPLARGALFVSSDHQHWYLKVSGLRPVAEGRVYTLWFMTDGGPRPGGVFKVEAGHEAEIGSVSMPSGMKAVLITLEPTQRATQPSGDQVLFGNEMLPIS